jgi:cell division protein FtsB
VYRQEAMQLEKLEREVVELRTRKERLAKEILRLRNDPRALEELVHRELGYVYPDEYILIMPEEEKNIQRKERREE